MSTPSLQSVRAFEADDERRGFRIGSVTVSLDSGRITGPGGTRQLDPKVLDVLVRLAAAEG